jgi:RHS repeat-associated protein
MNIDYGLGDFVKRIERFDGSTVSNAYDSAGRLAYTGISNSETGTPNVEVNRTYWPDGALKSVDDASSFVEYGYDLLNRLTSITSTVSSVSSVVDHQYDGVNLTNSSVQVSGFQFQVSSAYDAAERLTEIIADREDATTQRFIYSYNPENGRIASVSNSVSGLVCSYQYDLMDRATNITYRTGTNLVRSLDYEYDAVSMITKKTESGGASSISTAYTYDSLDRLVAEKRTADGSSAQTQYSYDLAGNRLSQTTEGWKTSYTLGIGNRLASSSTESNSTTFVSGQSSEIIGTDDLWGTLYISNLTANTGVVPDVNGSSFSAEVPVVENSTNVLVAAIRDAAGNVGYATNTVWAGDFTTENTEAQRYAYDAAGCLTNLNGTSLEWDERYRLVNVDAASCRIAYAYDVLGRKVSRTACFQQATNVEHYVYSGNQVVADLDGDGNLLRTYVWGSGIDNLLCFTDHTTSNTYYAVKDHQNSVLAMVDETGAVIESYQYDAWGNVTAFDASGAEIKISNIGNRYLFHGREIDWTTGLYYFRARWYDPETGRWLSKDPIGISGGLNLYAFVSNNPVNFVDPTGMNRWIVSEVIHQYLLVETWDDCGNSTGYKRIDFGPSCFWTCLLYSPGNLTVTDGVAPPSNAYEVISGAVADQILLETMTDLESDPPGYTTFYNCRTFSAQGSNFGLEQDW